MRAEGLQAAKKLWRVMKRSKGGCKYMGGEMNLSGVLGKQVGERETLTWLENQQVRRSSGELQREEIQFLKGQRLTGISEGKTLVQVQRVVQLGRLY